LSKCSHTWHGFKFDCFDALLLICFYVFIMNPVIVLN
jgi:hypothetical protein